MKIRFFTSLPLAACVSAALLLASCSSQKQMQSKVSDLEVECTPKVLEAFRDTIRANVELTFPKNYFKPTAMMVVTPVLVYADGQRTGKSQIFQGQDIKANYRMIPLSGGKSGIDVEFPFVKGMEQSALELQCKLILGGDKTIDLPALKAADGCIATYKLTDTRGEYSIKPDGFNQVTSLSTQTSILFDVGSAAVKNNSQNRNAINVYKSYLKDLENDPRYKVTGASIVAYASPEGGVELNDKLSKDRAKSAVNTWGKLSGGVTDSISVSSAGQDWEGFKEAMEDSDIEDKDLILRVLSMYSDPAVREQEIKNLSFIYEDIKKEVFPGLRRASFVINADHLGYSDEELAQMAQNQLSLLSEPEILHLASITDSLDAKKYYYRVTTERWGSNTGYYDLAVLALDEGKIDVALAYLTHTDEADPDVLNLLGVIQMRRGDLDAALSFFADSGTADAVRNEGTVYILKGEYGMAAKILRGTGSRNEALAEILAGNYEKALKLSSGNAPRQRYIAAVAAARLGDKATVKAKLDSLASCSCPAAKAYTERAAKDAEFADYR